ncbi:hypothetical protein HHL19_18645 [Streptomyces sp. R302]|uniref:hypothetical protein n=1 Tax=unclassified Streptomyces TaxID=2593676 RepID=UPI00145F6B70|nr:MULTISPECIES: hypothetical protein [unclassified Streptomyces]NML54799.1 hypothetical protein [Streptomyces sp. R301]NML80632.1 hypothetical protein [Streptomyces sp. R302]
MTRSSHRRGGRKGQSHTATPSLRSYSVPPASEVTITRPDGTVATQPAKKAQATVPARRRKGPPVCGMCGGTIEDGKLLFSWERGSARGKPVHRRCDPKARPQRPDRKGAAKTSSKNKYATPPPPKTPRPRGPVGTCPKCGAQPGQRCTVQYADGTTAEVEIGHAQRRAVSP